MNQPLIGIIMGSDSDLLTMKEAIAVERRIRHTSGSRDRFRPPHPRENGNIQQARKRGLKVIIASAGGAAHLPLSRVCF